MKPKAPAIPSFGVGSFESPLPSNRFSEPTNPLSTKREQEQLGSYNRLGFAARNTNTVPPLWKFRPSLRYADPTPRIVTQGVSDEGKREKLLMATTDYYNPAMKPATFYEQCFKNRRKIGEGSFGHVWRATSLDDGRDYAVKVAIVPYRTGADRELRLREVFKHERLPIHPNLVRFVKAWEEKGRLYIQTEICEESLEDYIGRKHEVSTRMVWNVFTDIASALSVLHERNFIHLDIKPANIFISSDGIFKLGDFGLIFDLNSDEKHSHEEGDSKYLAPEILNGPLTKAADIFSFGITVLEVATDLSLPSNGESWHQLRTGQIPDRFWQKVDPKQRALLGSMLDVDPLRRPTIETITKRLRHWRLKALDTKKAELCRDPLTNRHPKTQGTPDHTTTPLSMLAFDQMLEDETPSRRPIKPTPSIPKLSFDSATSSDGSHDSSIHYTSNPRLRKSNKGPLTVSASAGDWNRPTLQSPLPKKANFFDDDQSDEEIYYRQMARTLPLPKHDEQRVPMRQRADRRPIPKLDLSLLDEDSSDML
ncbi:unnamed protein product, partial [Mesorhabditis spiculigera]